MIYVVYIVVAIAIYDCGFWLKGQMMNSFFSFGFLCGLVNGGFGRGSVGSISLTCTIEKKKCGLVNYIKLEIFV